ncbi:MAG: hypothetical protein J0I45_16005 [Bosea sp.]|nr:hypothetical protein [Bosea sp. (in: a-proteobacteria)]
MDSAQALRIAEAVQQALRPADDTQRSMDLALAASLWALTADALREAEAQEAEARVLNGAAPPQDAGLEQTSL